MKNFKKIVLSILLGVLVIVPSTVYALTEVKTGEELSEAVKKGGEIVLQNDISMTSDITVRGQKINIDLNGNSLTLKTYYIDVYEGSLEFSGKGLIKDDREDTNATIYVYGSTDSKAVSFANLTVGKDVKIETKRYGITVWPVTENEKPVPTYGTVINFNGTIISTNENAGGITINGNIKNDGKLENAPIINIGKTAVVKATADTALYGAGMGVWNIDGGAFEGKSAIGIKSGKLVINDGTFTATGVPKTGELYGNGIISTGSSIQIENNKGYAGNIEITVNGGTFKSEKGLSIYHYPPNNEEGETNTLKSLIINGGTFTSDVKMVKGDNVSVTNGTFSTKTLESYIPNTYTMVKKSENEYVVSNIEFSEVEGLEAKITSNGTDNKFYAKPGSKVVLTFTIENNYFLKGLTVVGKDGSETKVEVTDNSFVMPEYAVKIIPDVIRCISKEGNIVQIDKEITFNESIDAKLVKDLSEAFLDNTNSGLANAINKEKIEATDESLVEVELETVLTSYDEKNNTLVYDIKPVYYVDGQKVGTLSNDAITGKVKVNLPVPTSVKDTHVKVLHKSGDKLVDEKSYEIKTTEDGKKYITIETNSFSTFELSFYTPTEVKNPTTADSTLGYGLLVLISLIGIGSAYGLMRKSFNK